jgi:hypothetical protein
MPHRWLFSSSLSLSLFASSVADYNFRASPSTYHHPLYLRGLGLLPSNILFCYSSLGLIFLCSIGFTLFSLLLVFMSLFGYPLVLVFSSPLVPVSATYTSLIPLLKDT